MCKDVSNFFRFLYLEFKSNLYFFLYKNNVLNNLKINNLKEFIIFELKFTGCIKQHENYTFVSYRENVLCFNR